MTHGTIIQSVDADGRTFIIVIHEAVLFYTLRQQNSSILQLTLNACEHCHSHLLKYEGWNFNSGNYLFTTDTK